MKETFQPSESQPKSQAPAKMITLEELMGLERELHLYHNHQVYRLRVTKANKLILTK